jgi:hypothetical protein
VYGQLVTSWLTSSLVVASSVTSSNLHQYHDKIDSNSKGAIAIYFGKEVGQFLATTPPHSFNLTPQQPATSS